MLTGIAALVTAIAGAIAVLFQIGVLGNGGESPPGPNPPEQQFRIVELHLRADPFDYRGPCPVTIEFSGRISVAGGTGSVSYRFIRSDGASAPVQAVDFEAPGSASVSNTWQLGRSYSGWQAIETHDPQEMESGRASFQIVCE